MYGKRYRRVEVMPDKLLDDDLPDNKLMFIGRCFQCDKASRQDTPSRYEQLDKYCRYWSNTPNS